jgi:hypothetical protein
MRGRRAHLIAVVATVVVTAGCASGQATSPEVAAPGTAGEAVPGPPTSDHSRHEPAETPGGLHDHDDVEFVDVPDGIEPTLIRIPAIGVAADVVDLDLNRRPDPEVPADFDDVGWYTATREPGEIGPAVLAGHIDSKDGPAVFHRLRELEPGDRIVLLDADGDRRVFTVDRAGQYPKTELPQEVFGFGDPRPELRLITCGGAFDTATGHYVDNYVVYASSR